jgi:hypothetical protein
MPIFSHKEFELIYEVYCRRRVQISATNLPNYKNVVESGLAKIEKCGKQITVFRTKKLITLLKADNPQKHLINDNCLTANNLKADNNLTANNNKLKAVGFTIADCVKHSSAPYVAVIDGKQPRRNPMTEYVKKLSPLDAADFWQAYGELSHDEQARYRRSFTFADR